MLLVSGFAHGATLYVDGDGLSDSGNPSTECNSTADYTAFQPALNDASDGDEIVLCEYAGGTYSGGEILSKNLVIRRGDGNSSKVGVIGKNNPTIDAKDNDVGDLTLKGLAIGSMTTNRKGILFRDNSGALEVQNIEVRSDNKTGIEVNGSKRIVSLPNSRSSPNLQLMTSKTGIDIDSSNGQNVLRDLRVETGGSGIDIRSGQQVLMSGCVIVNGNSTGVNIDGADEVRVESSFEGLNIKTDNAVAMQVKNASSQADHKLEGMVVQAGKDGLDIRGGSSLVVSGIIDAGKTAVKTSNIGTVDDTDVEKKSINFSCDLTPGGLDHYAINHSGTLVSCDAETVTVTAHDDNDDPVEAEGATISLDAINKDTGTGEGTWARVVSGSGTLNDATAGDGSGSYTFPNTGESSVKLAFNYTTVNKGSPETVNFDVVDGNGVAEKSSEDPDLTVSHSGLRITDGNGNPVAVPDQIAAKPSNTEPNAQTLGLQAIRTSNNDPSECEAAFPDGVSVEVGVGAECRDPNQCAGREMRVTNDGTTTAIDTSDDNGGAGAASYEPVNFTFGASAEAPLVLRYPDAGKIQLHFRFDPIDDSGDAPTVGSITGSSNDFVVRPFGFFVDFDPDGDGTFDDREANGSCGGQVSCAADASGDVFATAGKDFDLQVNAVVWQGIDDSDDDGVPDSNQSIADNALTPNFGQEATTETVDLTRTLVLPNGGSPGTLTGGASIGGFSRGSTSTALSWDEVGIIDLGASLSDGDYLGAGDVSGKAPNVGRFIPDNFEQVVADNGMFENVQSGFTYMGQQFGYEVGSEPTLTITARNADDATTANYTGAFAKLAPADVVRSAPTEDGTTNGRDGDPLEVNASLNVGTLVDNGDGTLSYEFAAAEPNDPNDPDQPGGSTDAYRYPRDQGTVQMDGEPVAVTRVADGDPKSGFDTALTIAIDSMQDSDGVTADVVNDATPDPAEIRFGRLLIDDGAGPEIAEVELPVRAEYWDGQTWRANLDESLTALTLGGTDNEIELINTDDPDSPKSGGETIQVGSVADSETSIIAPSSPVELTNGTATLTFDATCDDPPNQDCSDRRGWVDVTGLLEGKQHPYLRTDPDDDGIWDSDPTGRATFGIFTGQSENIYRREVFPAP